jgi:hypothetical protein
MATKTKATTIGNYITKVNNFDIRQKVSYKKADRGRDDKGLQVSSSEYVVCRGRNIIKAGLKSIDEAKAVANAQ